MKRNDLIEKLEIYYEQRRYLHITCKDRFYNGWIDHFDKLKNHIIFMDRELGEIIILYSEILNVEPYKKEER